MPDRVVWKRNMEKKLKNVHYFLFQNWLERESNDFLLLLLFFFLMNVYVSGLISLFQSIQQIFL